MNKVQTKPNTILVAVDVGTTKTVVMVADRTADNKISIRGVGQAPSNGCMRRGMVVNIDGTVDVVNSAVKEAQLMSASTFNVVYTSISGSHIRSANSEGIVAIRDNEVTHPDMERALETAKAIPISSDQQVLHTIAQEYVVDNHDGVSDPLGMAGVRLKVKVHMITGAVTAVSNIVKCITRSGLQVADVTLQALASSYSVLTQDEKDLGVVLIDIGGGTTDIAIFANGAVRHTAVIPVAGDHVTNDIAMALRTPTADAEELKLRWGVAKSELCSTQERLEVPGLGDREPRYISRMALSSVIEPRIAELFELVNQVIRGSEYEHMLASGIVLTGGSSLMLGMQELGEDVFARPVRIGVPNYSGVLSDVVCNPRYAAVIGLLQKANEEDLLFKSRPPAAMGFAGAMKTIKSWFY